MSKLDDEERKKDSIYKSERFAFFDVYGMYKLVRNVCKKEQSYDGDDESGSRFFLLIVFC